MVPVGAWCVDKYEASVWDKPDGSGKSYFTDSESSADTSPYVPTGEGNYPQGCYRTGAGCKQFAVSKPKTIPSRGMTWYQALKFCANSGKVLIPDSLWQTAAIGTQDNGSETGSGGTLGGSVEDGQEARCNINTQNEHWTTWLKPHNGVRPTARAGKTFGSKDSCVSDYGVEDMVGNLWEWTDLGAQPAGIDMDKFTRGKYNAQGGPFKTPDGTWNVQGSAFSCDGEDQDPGVCEWKNNMPTAIFRGGGWGNAKDAGVFSMYMFVSGSFSKHSVGFRCARPR